MPTARHQRGTVYKNGAPIFLARVVGNDGALITQAGISAITYTVSRLDPNDPDSRTAITNHTAVSLTVSAVVFDTLQRDDLWQDDSGEFIDSLGYNLKFQPSVATSVPFAVAGASYLCEARIVPTSGEPILVTFEVRCI